MGGTSPVTFDLLTMKFQSLVITYESLMRTFQPLTLTIKSLTMAYESFASGIVACAALRIGDMKNEGLWPFRGSVIPRGVNTGYLLARAD